MQMMLHCRLNPAFEICSGVLAVHLCSSSHLPNGIHDGRPRGYRFTYRPLGSTDLLADTRGASYFAFIPKGAALDPSFPRL